MNTANTPTPDTYKTPMEAFGAPTPWEAERESAIDVVKFAQDVFLKQGMEQTGNIIYDEVDMRLALLAGLVTRAAVGYSGPPGTGKTLLGRNAYKLVYESSLIGEDSFVNLPPDSNIQEMDIAGGEFSDTKYVSNGRDGRFVPERAIKMVDALVTPNHYGIFADELTRVNPFATNAMLSAPEEKLVRTGKRIVQLPLFQVMVSTYNPAEGKEATFEIGHALGSRHSIGVLAGNHLSLDNKAKMLRGIMPNEAVQPIASVRQLNLMRAAADKIEFPDAEMPKWLAQIDEAERVMHKELGVTEKGRLIVQVGKTARALALFGGSDTVRPADFDKAMQFALGSRVGSKHKDVFTAPEKLHDIAEQAKKAA